MTGRQHLVFGTTIGITAGVDLFGYTLTGSPKFTIATVTAGCILGCLLPDIDNPDSTAGHQLPILSRFLNKHIGHRTYTHSVLGLMLCVLLTFLFIPRSLLLFTLSVCLGVASHLFLDALTISGVPLFCLRTNHNKWNRHFHLLPKFLRCRTGSAYSWFLLFVLTIACPILLHMAAMKLTLGA